MRCKKHYTDLSSAIGVCACCLRERLLFLIDAQEKSSSLAANSTTPFNQHHHSVSPFNNHRKSDPNHHPPHVPRHHHTFSDQLLYQTPQLNPTTAGDISGAIQSNKKRSFIRFFSFQNIFRSRNRNPVDPPDIGAVDNVMSSSSWLSITLNKRDRRKKTASVDETYTAAAPCDAVRRQCGNRGMSPVRTSEFNEDELGNGYESTESWKNTPWRTPAVKRGGGHVRNLSFCLSPLVRASPNRQRNNNKGLQPDGVLSGEIRAPVKPHLSNTKSFCANRSRKLADFGRANLNR